MIEALVRWVAEHGFWLLVGVFFLALAIYFLERKVRRLEARVAALKEAANAFEEQLEKEAVQPAAPGAPAAAPPARTNWDDIRAHWRVVRDRLEELILEIDGRRQRTYDRTSRYSYRPIIDMLREDKQIDAYTATFLHSMNERFLGLRRNARNVPAESVAGFIDCFNSISAKLNIKPPAKAPLIPTNESSAA